MIECQYCYTRNKDDAPTCQACGGPLGESSDDELQIWCPSPSEPDKFVRVGSIHRFGVSVEEATESLSYVFGSL